MFQYIVGQHTVFLLLLFFLRILQMTFDELRQKLHRGISPNGWHQHINGLGWVENTAYVDPNVYVGMDAVVADYAMAVGFSKIQNRAMICGTSKISGRSKIYDDALIIEQCIIDDEVTIFGHAVVGGHAHICGNSMIYGNSIICDYAQISGYSEVCDEQVGGNSNIINRVIKGSRGIQVGGNINIIKSMVLSQPLSGIIQNSTNKQHSVGINIAPIENGTDLDNLTVTEIECLLYDVSVSNKKIDSDKIKKLLKRYKDLSGIDRPGFMS